MNRKSILLTILLCVTSWAMASPVTGLLERIDKGASKKFIIEQVKSDADFFELDQKGDKVVIRGNNYVSIATGLNWYLKYYAGIHLSWNGMQAKLPAVLPPVTKKERRETTLPYRYDLNYCTFSYSMAFSTAFIWSAWSWVTNTARIISMLIPASFNPFFMVRTAIPASISIPYFSVPI